MKHDKVLEIFHSSGALLEGHFLLTSGLHSPNYFQCARVLQYPHHCTQLCTEISNAFKHIDIDVVVSPAIGGIIVGQEVARQLGKRAIFSERENGVMTFRRGLTLSRGEKVLAVEDVITTGGSIRETIELCRHQGAEIIGAACIVDRSAGKADLGTPLHSVLQMQVTTYEPAGCPLCQQGLELVKPGSRQNPSRTR